MIIKKRKRNWKEKDRGKGKIKRKENNSIHDVTNSGIKTSINIVGEQKLSDNLEASKIRINKKLANYVVYINEFDKLDANGIEKCRNNNCVKFVCKPYRKYCSKKCSKEFTRWYNSNFYWRNIRNHVLKRDGYTCQICGIKLERKKKNNKAAKNWLECDHIIPKSYYSYLGYNFDTLENKVKTVLEFFHNENNLRTLCYKCHRKSTVNIYKEKALLSRPKEGLNE